MNFVIKGNDMYFLEDNLWKKITSYHYLLNLPLT
jgi:hypothetical protein